MLDSLINTCIYNYPILFKVRNNYELSRLRVLNHIFFVVGNGFKIENELIHTCNQNLLLKIDELPTGFMEKELYNLPMYFPVDFANHISINSFLQNRFNYLLNREYIVESTQDELTKVFGTYLASYAFLAECNHFFKPYPLSKSSLLVKLTGGTVKLNEACLSCAIEVAFFAKAYYHNLEDADFRTEQLNYINAFLERFYVN